MSYQREYTKRLKIAIVGIGSHAYRNILPALNYLPVNLVAVCNRSNAELGQLTAAQYGCAYYQSTTEMYAKEELDAVFISVSPQAHAKLAIEALDAGLHVWLEKPVAMCVNEVEQILERRKNNIVVVGYKKAFMPATKKAIEIINSPKYGDLVSMTAVYPITIPENGAQILKDGTKTDWLNNGCHTLSLMLATGGKVDSVVSYRGKYNTGVNILQFANGVIGNFHMASGPQPIEDYHFYSDKWHMQIDDSSRVILERGIPSVYGKTTSFVPEGDDTGAIVWTPQNCKATLENKAEFIQGMYQELQYFCDCVLEDKKPEICSLEFALELTKVSEALLLSNGNTIRIC